jgi:hypothetical protein
LIANRAAIGPWEEFDAIANQRLNAGTTGATFLPL